ncbi:serine hydrolase domain-containing protein [Longispora sp. K20-0274]|uniref:serine hydrolase domain-containing protein n=1 Tax=Longispora sp. K20-0274 TaxID=3088255 RepID=UPI00399B27B5
MADLTARLARLIDEHRIPGASVAYSVHGAVTEAAAGVVNRDTGVRVTPDSVFQMGSVTKLWTATLVQQLVDDGLLDLDEPVRRHLPDLRLADEGTAAGLTSRDLLRHTTGFAGDIFDDHGRGDDAVGRLVAQLAGADPIAARGELFSYCNAGYCVLGHLVATLRGTTWEGAVREFLIGPLGLTDAALFAEEAILFRAAVGHVGPERAVYPRWQMPRSVAPAGSTACVSARTLLAFGQLFLDGGRDGVLSPAAVERGWRPQVAVPGGSGRRASHWGLGWMLFDWGGTRVVGHDGSTPGQSAYFRLVPEAGLVIAGLANGGDAPALYHELIVPLIEELTGITVPAAPVPPAEPVPVDAAPYVGSYVDTLVTYRVSPAGSGLTVTEEPGQFAREAGASTSSAVYAHLDGDRFIRSEPVQGTYPVLTFVRADGGPATHLHNTRAIPRRERA